MNDAIKGIILIAVIIPIGIRVFIKTGNNDYSIGKIDYAIAAGLVSLIIILNL